MATQGASLESPPLPAPSARSRARRIFLKEGKLRVGWRLLIFGVLWSYCMAGLFSAAAPLFTRIHGSFPQYLLLLWTLGFLAVVIPTAVMALIERRPLGVYGLPARGAFGALYWKGTLWGLAAITGLMLALWATGAFYFGEIVLHGAELAWYAGSWALVWLLLAFMEQYLWLGYPRFTMTEGIGFWPAVTLLSAIYGGIHLVSGGGGVNWINGLWTGLIALFSALTLRRTGNLWFAVGMHASYTWGRTFLYSISDRGSSPPGYLLSSHFEGPAWLTGGSVGPEGSVFGFVMLAVLFAAFHWKYPQVRYPHGVEPAPQGPKVSP